ncbi:aquaporin-8-like [Polymixia lowei]
MTGILMENATQTEEKQNISLGWYDEWLLPCVAEFFGTLLFVFSGCASVFSTSSVTGSLQTALAHGLALSICIAFTCKISGGHLNPAVTLGVTVFSPSQFDSASGGAFNAMQSGSSLYSIILAEIIMTFFLVLTVCMTTVNRQSKTPLAPFCIGLVVTASVLGAGGVSGGCMNPARAFGPAVVGNYWSNHWVYWVGPLVAALLVGFVMRFLLGDPRIRLVLKKKPL